MQHSTNSALQRALARARQAEETIRLSAFLGDFEEINGVKVRLLTPRMLGTLVLMKSPFVGASDRIPTREDVLMFLWIVSPEFVPADGASDTWWARFFRRLLNRPAAAEKRDAFIMEVALRPRAIFFKRAIYRYLWRMRMDAPPMPSGGRRISASWIAATAHRIAAAYSWPDEVLDGKGRPIAGVGVLDKPLPRLYQYLKWIQIDKDASTPQFDPISLLIRTRLKRRQQRDVASNKQNGRSDLASSKVSSHPGSSAEPQLDQTSRL